MSSRELINKSKSDSNTYYLKYLENKLKCLLISDTSTDKSSASLLVKVGSLSDPKEYYGLAHFCEHMLFLGTEKYPIEGQYREYLYKNNGSSNAYTSKGVTNYHFECSNEGFNEALDRFGNFFISPLFNKESIDREMNAVDSENKKNLNNDSWRLSQLKSSEANPNSPFHHFSTGNLQTLKKNGVYEALIDFYKKYYSSDAMCLCVYSNQSISDLSVLVENIFSKVPKNENYSPPIYNTILPYDEKNLGFLYKIFPIKDKDSIDFNYFLPDTSLYYKKKPLNFLSSVIGHEGPNTLTSSLKKDDLIISLLSSGRNVVKTYSVFSINISLTKKGLENYEEVILRVLKYIKFLQGNKINKRYFDEYQKIKQIDFDYKSKNTSRSEVKEYSVSLNDYEDDDILTGKHLVEEYDEELIKKFLDLLNEKNLNIYFSSKQFENECNLIEEWYETKYSKEKFDFTEKVNNYSFKTLHDYPPENKFIPTNLDLLPINADLEKIKYPEKIFSNEKCELWYKQDTQFKLPKACIKVKFLFQKNICNNASIKNKILSSITSTLIKKGLNEILYMAEEAKVKFSFDINSHSLTFDVSGFNSSMNETMKIILETFKKIDFNSEQEKFDLIIKKLIQKYKNFYLDRPSSVCKTYLDIILLKPSSTANEKLNCLQNYKITLEDAIKFKKEILNNAIEEWLIQGNLSKENALEIFNISNQSLGIDINNKNKIEITPIRAINISNELKFTYKFFNPNKKEKNSSIICYYQCGEFSSVEKLKDKIYLNVLSHPLRDKFFNILRTKEALGYIATMTLFKLRGIFGFKCAIQSNVKNPEFIIKRVENFLLEMKNYFNNISDEDFKSYVNSSILALKKKDTNLSQEVSRNFDEIIQHSYLFNRREIEIELLEKCNKEELKKIFNYYFFENIKLLKLEYISDVHKEENENMLKEKENDKKEVILDSIYNFQDMNNLYPDYYFKKY